VLLTILWRLTRTRTDFAEYNLQVISSVYKYRTQSADSPCDDLSVSTRDSQSADKICSGASTDQLILHVALNQLTTQATSGAHVALSLGFQGLAWDADVLVREVVFKWGQMSGRTRGRKPEEEHEEDREDAVSPAFSYFSVSSSPSQAAPESPSSSRQASL
jgi:hypothetical protein